MDKIRFWLEDMDLEARYFGGAVLLFALSLLAVSKSPIMALLLMLASGICMAVSFWIWALPFFRTHWEKPWMRLLRLTTLGIVACVQTGVAASWIAQTTGFSPTDYPLALAIVAILLFVPCCIAVIVVIIPGLALTIAALVGGGTLVLVPVFTVTSKWPDIPDKWGRRLLTGYVFFALVGFSCARLADYSRPFLDKRIMWIVAEVEYHQTYNHPWRSVWGSAQVHFHDNGLVTSISEADPLTIRVVVPPTKPQK